MLCLPMPRTRTASEVKRDGLAALALFETVTAPPASNPLIHAGEFTTKRRAAIAGEPAHKKQVEFDDDPRGVHAPCPAGNPPDLLPGAMNAFGRDPEFAVQKQPVAEELAFPDRGNGALFAVYPKLEFLFQKPGDRFRYPT
jgi:hypothetical protein